MMLSRSIPFRSLRATCRYYPWLQRFNSNVAPVAQRSMDIQLREYQEECIQAVVDNLDQGRKRLGVSLATGGGKTVIFTHLISRVPPNPVTKGTQTLILVHRKELLDQAFRHCKNTYPDLTVEAEMNNLKASGLADITIASVRSLTSKDRIEKFKAENFKLILVDEAHHIVAQTYMSVLDHFNLTPQRSRPEISDDKVTALELSPGPEQALIPPSAPALVGVSATLSRGDGLRLGAALDHIVYHKDYVDMIGSSYLSPVIFTTVKSHVDLSAVQVAKNGDYMAAALSNATNTDEANEIAVRSWMHKAAARKSTLVFAVDVQHTKDLCEKFAEHGVDARYVIGEHRAHERNQTLDDFKSGKFPVLINCGVFTEGTDIPNIDCVLLCRPTRSRNLLVQMIGRGMRLSPSTDKNDCHIIDMVASLGIGIVTVPTLFGLDPDELVNEADIDAITSIKASKDSKDSKQSQLEKDSKRKGLSISKVTFTDYSTLSSLLSDARPDQHIRVISPNAWVCVSPDRYILPNRFEGHLEIEGTRYPDGTTFFVLRYNEKVGIENLKPGAKWRPFKRSRELARVASFEHAVHAADSFIAADSKFQPIWVRRDAPWRSAPVSKGQLTVLKSMSSGAKKTRKRSKSTDSDKEEQGIQSSRATRSRRSDREDPKDGDPSISAQDGEDLKGLREEWKKLNKGQATDMITKLKFGAKSWFQKIQSEAKRRSVIVEREEKVKRREKVEVGPLE